jgi:hypothetical protein
VIVTRDVDTLKQRSMELEREVQSIGLSVNEEKIRYMTV